MTPLIRSGDVLHVETAERYRPGDVLVVGDAGGWIVHRLLSERRDPDERASLVLRGDARRVPDPPIRPDEVLGRVARLERRGSVRRLDGPFGLTMRWLAARSVRGRPLVFLLGAALRRAERIAEHFCWRRSRGDR